MAGARDTCPPLGSNSFIFMQFSANILQNEGWRTHSEIIPLGNPGTTTGFVGLLGILLAMYLSICIVQFPKKDKHKNSI